MPLPRGEGRNRLPSTAALLSPCPVFRTSGALPFRRQPVAIGGPCLVTRRDRATAFPGRARRSASLRKEGVPYPFLDATSQFVFGCPGAFAARHRQAARLRR